MTERTRGSQPSGSPQEAIDLNELHASKTQEQLRASAFDSANTDLASASIQSISVVRLSTRPEKRKLTNLSPSLDTETSTLRDPKVLKRPVTKSNQKHGIFKNPYFPYEGGPLGRLISLLANLMKVVELAIFNNPQHAQPPTPIKTGVIKAKKRDAHGREIDEEDEKSDVQPNLTTRPNQE